MARPTDRLPTPRERLDNALKRIQTSVAELERILVPPAPQPKRSHLKLVREEAGDA